MTEQMNMSQQSVDTAPAPVKKRKIASLDRRKARAGWLFVLPFVIGFIVLYVPILIDSIRSSFYFYDVANNNTKVFLGGYAALLTAYYLKFCLDYPYLCTFNFRYIMTLLPLAALAFAHGREGLRRGARLIDALAALFAAGTSAAYLLWFFGVA